MIKNSFIIKECSMKEKNNSIIDPCGEEGVIIENIIVTHNESTF